MVTREDYCPACQGHGTDVHECEALRSAVVRAADLEHILHTYCWGRSVYPEDVAIIQRLWDIANGDSPST